MTNSPASGSEEPPPPPAFELLHRGVQRWIWDQGWNELRDAQERAIPLLLAGDRDLVIAASTAAGKTEAAFLPIVSVIATERRAGIEALYVGPLKALINDQFRRLDDLCEDLEIPVHRWHGDVSHSRKQALLENPSGVLLITPESLEGLFIRHGSRLAAILAPLRYCVIDELHAFIGTERGRQLQSQLHRIELLLRRRVARVGLSATLGDMDLAREALRPGERERVDLVSSQVGGQELRAQVRAHERLVDETGDPESSIAAHLFRTLRGSNNLVFANARRTVEELADGLRELCEAARVPVEFVAHHGSLARELREDAETRLAQGELPVTAVCTSTLELGVDLGAVKSVAQIGAPRSVASLRQRLGRSGRRRGEAAILRVYVEEAATLADSDPIDALRIELVQSIAVIRLLIAGWCEPPDDSALHASTLVQQVLSMIAQHGGLTASEAHGALCATGPFRGFDPASFAYFLRGLATSGLIAQEPDGSLALASKGERLVDHYSFLAAFAAKEEFRVVHDGKAIGSIALDPSLAPGDLIVLAGRRWSIETADLETRVIRVRPAAAGRAPRFFGAGAEMLHDRVRQEMHTVWVGDDEHRFTSAAARDRLAEARAAFADLGLREWGIVPCRDGALAYVPHGDRIVHTIRRALTAPGAEMFCDGPFLRAEGHSAERLRDAIGRILAEGPIDAEKLAQGVVDLRSNKHDWAVDRSILVRDHAARTFDAEGAERALRELIEDRT